MNISELIKIFFDARIWIEIKDISGSQFYDSSAAYLEGVLSTEEFLSSEGYKNFFSKQKINKVNLSIEYEDGDLSE